jgi:hypothetical protein
MIYQFLSYIKFLLKSQNQHGLHSPFVYDFVTKGLYKKGIKNSSFKEYSELQNLSKKQQKVLSKIVKYFKIDIIYFDSLNFTKTLDKYFKILYINNIEFLSKNHLTSLSSKHIIVINGIYQDKKSYKKWQKIIENKEITVSIDLLYFGLIFFRKEQAKEHFKIRV